MNKEIKQQWLDALRSGRYTQNTSSCLRTADNKFCCLGVLCDLAEKAGVVPKPTLCASGRNYNYLDTDPKRLVNGQPFKNGGYVSYQVMQWAGLSDCNPPVIDGEPGKQINSLALLNDSGDYSFAQLAKLIEAQL